MIRLLVQPEELGTIEEQEFFSAPVAPWLSQVFSPSTSAASIPVFAHHNNSIPVPGLHLVSLSSPQVFNNNSSFPSLLFYLWQPYNTLPPRWDFWLSFIKICLSYLQT